MKFHSLKFEIASLFALLWILMLGTSSVVYYFLNPAVAWRPWVYAILISLPLMLVLTSFAGHFLSYRILRPVDEITRLARRISQQDLSSRIKSKNFHNEMVSLIESFNEMIDRLEHSFKHMEQFSHHVAHELKTPMTIIQGEADLLLRRDRNAHEYKQALKIIGEESQRVLKTVDDLLLLNRLDYYHEVFKFEQFDFLEFFDEIVEQNRLLAAHRSIAIRLQLQSPDHAPLMIEGHRLHLRRLFFSLIDNGIKFTPQGGAIDMRLELDQDKIISFIKDTGPGLDSEHVRSIFKDVPSMDLQDASGDGLSLNIAYMIAKLHLGDIQVESQKDRGTTFKVILPLGH